MRSFVDRAKPLTSAAAQIARIKGANAEAAVLEKATASLVETGYDNWDGGITFHTLMLEVPILTYATIDDEREALEKSILNRLTPLVRAESGNRITEVVISPVLLDDARPVGDNPPEGPIEDQPSFWQPGFFRLFITHLAAHKSSAHRLKEALAKFQIASFVAHDDIEPTKEWQPEIERALRTMDALVAIVAPGFVESRWCDQEVGIAVGRGKLVIPLCAGADPHGFIGKHQGVQVKGLDANGIAEKVFEILIGHTLSSQRMSDALVERISASPSWETSKKTLALLEKTTSLNELQVARLVRAIEENSEVRNAFGVPERIRALVSRLGSGLSQS